MSYTTTQLAVAVLRKLRVIDATETQGDVETAILSHVTDSWRAKWDELSGHGADLTYFPYTTIPNPVFLTIVDLMANEMRADFGQPLSASEKEVEEQTILRRLRRHTQVDSSGKPTESLFF